MSRKLNGALGKGFLLAEVSRSIRPCLPTNQRSSNPVVRGARIRRRRPSGLRSPRPTSPRPWTTWTGARRQSTLPRRRIWTKQSIRTRVIENAQSSAARSRLTRRPPRAGRRARPRRRPRPYRATNRCGSWAKGPSARSGCSRRCRAASGWQSSSSRTGRRNSGSCCKRRSCSWRGCSAIPVSSSSKTWSPMPGRPTASSRTPRGARWPTCSRMVRSQLPTRYRSSARRRRHWPTSTSRASFTATSSPATSCATPAAGPSWPTSDRPTSPAT